MLAMQEWPSMARLIFTENLQRHVRCPPTEAEGTTVREVLDRAFASNELARGYVLDEHGAVRHHMVIFVDGVMIQDRQELSDAVAADAEVYVMQALSGGSGPLPRPGMKEQRP